MSIKAIVYSILFLIPHWLNSQTNDEIINTLRYYELDSSVNYLSSFSEKTKNVLDWQIQFIKTFEIGDSKVESIEMLEFPTDRDIGDFYFNINFGDFYFYSFSDKNVVALDYYKKALDFSLKLKNRAFICEALKKILSFHRIEYLYDNSTYQTYLELYKLHKYDKLEDAYYNYFDLILNFKNYRLDYWNNNAFKELNNYFAKNDNPYLKGIAYTVYASYYEELNKKDSIWYYTDKALKEFSKIKYNYHGSRLNQLNMFIARIALKEGKIEYAKNAIIQATNINYNKTDLKIESLSHFYNSIIDTLNNDYKSAFSKLQKYNSTRDNIREYRYADLLNELETKYQTAEKEKQILIEQQKKKQNRNIAFGLGGLLLFGGVTFLLIQKNTKRKQLLAEQDKELQTQKLATVLKEQELTSIDAMIEGQEKERQRIANDLHDDLGGLMATVKLHFNALKENQSPELYDKTTQLLDDAYNKVRSVAHTKNSGVMAKKGLLKAINDMAKTISDTNKLQIDVIDHGLENRLENSLELTIFRIVQELITNIIKHAEATEATIHITNHDDSLNIMVEDNGKGFNTKNIHKSSGMGIHSIDKRVENLGGTVTIESELNKGTTIIIDIPS